MTLILSSLVSIFWKEGCVCSGAGSTVKLWTLIGLFLEGRGRMLGGDRESGQRYRARRGVGGGV